MLVLTVERNESVHLLNPETLETIAIVTVTAGTGKIKLGFQAPEHVRILRAGPLAKVLAERRAQSEISV